MPHQPFRDQLAERRRTMLLLFYSVAVLSVIAVTLAGRTPPLRTPLLSLGIAAAVAAIFLLLRFLRSNDEHQRKIKCGASD